METTEEHQMVVAAAGSDSINGSQFDYSGCHANCMEKIVICIDVSAETERTFLRTRDNQPHSILLLWKNALELFVWNKLMMNPNHQLAIVLLGDHEATWFMDFSSDAKDICSTIATVTASTADTGEDPFDISTLFRIILENAAPPAASPSPILPPKWITRSVLLYGRSSSIPVYKGEPHYKLQLTESPYFFLDILYAHEEPELMNNNCETIFNILAELQCNPPIKILDIWHNATRMFDHMTRLLAHPLQRPPTSDEDHRLPVANDNPNNNDIDTELEH